MKRPFRPWGWLLLALALGVVGCAALPPEPGPPPEADLVIPPPPPPAGDGRLAQAGELYRAGLYGQAGAAFKELVGSADPEEAQQARFGQACAALALARTDRELTEALALWRAWSSQARLGQAGEDPRFLDPVLPRLRLDCPPERRVPALEAEVTRTRRQLEDARRTNKRLQDQLKALEDLHRELQRKRERTR